MYTIYHTNTRLHSKVLHHTVDRIIHQHLTTYIPRHYATLYTASYTTPHNIPHHNTTLCTATKHETPILDYILLYSILYNTTSYLNILHTTHHTTAEIYNTTSYHTILHTTHYTTAEHIQQSS